MKQLKWLIGPAVLALALQASTPVHAADDTTAAPKVKHSRSTGTRKPATPGSRQVSMLGRVLGKKLTAEQAQAVVDANSVYRQSVAKAVGLTPEELDAKMKAYAKSHKGTRKKKAKPSA